ncbi:Phospho-N-acetylmuramoyl-pentapeptide-transferase [Candidatus Lokiarchaeum ossiferum]|uniref:Phospho-N-acetylmuramoyl-pentapeptide-transferase n=1 Tax=Candidatus Lokiarchaeum ossiferum TaxID=2951803 RepID=A0ABY6HV89_9ARCH|nr:Phospho-N-acetylmuramoyl-pentapeptide-transferase [Candidatus Lokiarchaeum sp. B-35]
MNTFDTLSFTWIDYLLITLIGGIIFTITYLIYPPLIKWLKEKGYVGYDIHKIGRPATAESGGLGLTIGILIGSILAFIFFSKLWAEILTFDITIIIAAIIGWYDDRHQLGSLKKIVLMFITGIPLFIANLLTKVDIENPTLPILGQLRLNIIYPLMVPFIIMILTNTVNMLEGYNGEGSGTTSIALLVMVIAAIILKSGEGLLFGIISFAAVFAFFLFNKYPAKAFPGDIGTLVIGAAIGAVGVMGSIEVVMVIVMLPQVFNSFYVITSEKGFRESHSVSVQDIWIDKDELIHASDEIGAALTLPRLIVVTGALNEKELVNHFMALSLVSGFLALISTQFLIPLEEINWIVCTTIGILSVIGYIFVIRRYRRILMLSVVMGTLLGIALIFLIIINQFIFDITYLVNWLIGGVIGLIILAIWYGVTLIYFKRTLKKQKMKPGYISIAERKQNEQE